MATPIRAIETEQYRLVHFRLPTGEQYCMFSEEAAPVTIRTLKGSEQNLTAARVLKSYEALHTPLLFYHTAGITVYRPDVSTRNFLFKEAEKEPYLLYPIPLLEVEQLEALSELTERIQTITLTRYFRTLYDLQPLEQAFANTISNTIVFAEAGRTVVTPGDYDRFLSLLTGVSKTKSEIEKIIYKLQVRTKALAVMVDQVELKS